MEDFLLQTKTLAEGAVLFLERWWETKGDEHTDYYGTLGREETDQVFAFHTC